MALDVMKTRLGTHVSSQEGLQIGQNQIQYKHTDIFAESKNVQGKVKGIVIKKWFPRGKK